MAPTRSIISYAMGSFTITAFLVTLCLIILTTLVRKWANRSHGPAPISVNYHFTRKCNKECGFCFHTAKTSDVASVEDAKRGLTLLKRAGMKKMNFAGGEPFLYPKLLGRST